MILTDREIKNSLASGLIVIDPLPADDAYDSTTVDLTLDPVLRIFRKTAPGLKVAVDPGAPGYKAADLINGVTDTFIIPDDGWDLNPSLLVLGWTKERVDVKIQARLAARVE